MTAARHGYALQARWPAREKARLPFGRMDKESSDEQRTETDGWARAATAAPLVASKPPWAGSGSGNPDTVSSCIGTVTGIATAAVDTVIAPNPGPWSRGRLALPSTLSLTVIKESHFVHARATVEVSVSAFLWAAQPRSLPMSGAVLLTIEWE